jgi:hypothetical protein
MGAIFDQKDYKDGEAVGILSRLFRKILSELNITPMVWNKLMQVYLNDNRNRIPRSSRGRSSTRGNLNKELKKSNMTWSNFEKGMRFLNPLRSTFTVELQWLNGKITTHTFDIGVSPGPIDPED